MKIRAQIGMVLNLDKCLGCHTCSVVCKNVWTSREGVEYAWFNNVETKPGLGYPEQWEDQTRWKGGWIRKINGQIQLKLGGRVGVISHIFANRVMPEITDYYEPFSFNYQTLQKAGNSQHQPIARPYSLISGKTMDKIGQGPNWEDMLGGPFSKRGEDQNFEEIEKEIYADFERSFMLYLPRLCEHCLNPACVASCPSGAMYKREEDGVVLIDQDLCRGWRLCVSACPYKKIYFNWKSGKSEKCILCYPRLESGQPTLCSEGCVGRIRYLGILLYDADRIEEIAKTEDPQQLYQQQRGLFLNPHDVTVQKAAREQGIPDSVIDAAQRSPVYKMAVEWQLALPLHPEYRTLPMVWYVPSLSPIQQHASHGLPLKGMLPDIEQLSIPLRYLANLLAAGDTKPVVFALRRLLAMRHFKRSQQVDNNVDLDVLNDVGLTEEQVEEMYRYLAIANYEDRFVIPSSHRELAKKQFPDTSSCGFTFGEGCRGSDSRANLFDARRMDTHMIDTISMNAKRDTRRTS